LSLAGCDKLTISPKLLADLEAMVGKSIPHRLVESECKDMDIPIIPTDEKSFRFLMNGTKSFNLRECNGNRKIG
jgi:hypothetical protein